MKLEQILKGIDLADFGGINAGGKDFGELEINKIEIDSNKVRQGDVFVCLKGEKADGHDFARTAQDKGARAVVVERKIDGLEIPQIVVGETRSALSKMAVNYFGNPRQNFRLIGITGTNGKTTTTYMIKSILESAGQKVGLIGTLGYFIGENHFESNLTTPDPLELQRIFREMADSKVDTVVMEVSAHAIALNKLAGVRFDVGVLTNVTQDHLDFFGTFENYRDTKSKFLKPKYCTITIVNADDSLGQDIVIAMQNIQKSNFCVVSYGINSPADNFATAIKYDLNGTHYFLNIDDNLICINTRLIGEFNIYNALASASACYSVGVSLEAIKEGLNSMDFVPGRINIIRLNNGAGVVIDYAHTPDGLENILSTMRKITKGRLISVFGCGGNRDTSKRAIMGEISENVADFTVLTSDNPRLEKPESIILDIEKGMSKSSHISIPDRKQAIFYALERLNSGDVAVIAGKGAEDYLDIMGKKVHYSDFETVQEFRERSNESKRC